jgi:hypothetical protein
MQYTFQDAKGNASTDTCSTSLQTTNNAIELKMESTASEIGFLDKEVDQMFACQPFNKPSQPYTVNITIKNEKTGVVSAVATSKGLIVQQPEMSNSVKVISMFFEDATNYTVTCKAQTDDGRLKGTAVRQFTTTAYLFDFDFKINPYQGMTIDTVFHMWVDKRSNSLMDCQFGYENNRGELRIDVNQNDSFDYTSERQ